MISFSLRATAAIWIGTIWLSSGFAQEAIISLEQAQPTQAADENAQTAEELQAAFDKAPLRFEFTGGESGDEKLELVKQPLLNWSNPERRTPAGAVYIWILDGRPEVALSLYPNNGVIDQEFQSLSRHPLIAKQEGLVVWHPRQPGLEMKPLESEMKPAGSKPARLRQMRALAREFTCKLAPPGKSIPARMLPAPLFRYASEKSGVIDGALFAFVQGTDPEVLLLIEAVTDDQGQPAWQYGLARMSMVPMEVLHHDDSVWEVDWAQQSHSTPYRVVPGE
ncbi:hypothetical protein DTL42_18795 [Bremerella cremea]|uniref:Uncharacterized protein n=1 Tax=Bremerella cremea TaxID=1031537 RepID=A0A368KMJ3_9BACT|nr:hypothetical protein [Bremerella cremea]RCS43546.1 hypothetical protein DTL42_18795 [Bremerella cremea]